MLIAAAVLPVPAAAQNEYDLNLPGAGGGDSSDSSDESTAPVVPIAPTVTAPGVTETSEAGGGKNRRDRDRDRRDGPTDPVLTTSGVNATAGPQEIPTLQVPDDEGGVPTLAAGGGVAGGSVLHTRALAAPPPA